MHITYIYYLKVSYTPNLKTAISLQTGEIGVHRQTFPDQRKQQLTKVNRRPFFFFEMKSMMNQSIESTQCWTSLMYAWFFFFTIMTSLLKTSLAIVLFIETSVSLNLKISNEATYLMTTIKLFTKSVL